MGDDVYEGFFAPDGSVLYLSDYSTSRYRGDLYRYDGGKSTKLDDDVNSVLFYIPDGFSIGSGLTTRYRFSY